MSNKRWKFVKTINNLSLIKFDNEYYIEVPNQGSKHCSICDLIGTYGPSGCYVFVDNKQNCPAQHRNPDKHSIFRKGGI